MRHESADNLKFFFLCYFYQAESMLGVSLRKSVLILSLLGIFLNIYFVASFMLSPGKSFLYLFIATAFTYFIDFIANLLLMISYFNLNYGYSYLGYALYSVIYIVQIIKSIIPFLVGSDSESYGKLIFTSLIVELIYIIIRPYFTYIIFSWTKHLGTGGETDNSDNRIVGNNFPQEESPEIKCDASVNSNA